MNGRLTITAIALFTSLLVLTVLVWMGLTENFDHAWRQAALDLDQPDSLAVWKNLSVLGSGLVITSLTLGFILALVLMRRWFDARYLGVVMIAAVLIETLLKWSVHRPRPDQVIAYAMPISFSFPSGHALFATAFYGASAVIVSPWLAPWARALIWISFVGLVCAIGASRIFLGVHYATDVVSGFVAGAMCVVAMKQANVLARAKR